MKRLTKILATPLAGAICFLFGIANRIIFTSLNSLIGTDTKIQLTYAQNLLAGKGMGVTKYFTNDLNAPVFDTQQLYPPGLSLTIIPFLKIFNSDEFSAILVFDSIVAILFIIVIRAVGKKIGLPPELNNMVILMAGCVQYIFFMSWSSTDAISLVFVLFSLIETINIISKKEPISFLRVAGCGLLFCMPFFFRYMYLPVAILLPVTIMLSGIVLKNRFLKTGGLRILAVSVLSLIVLFSFSLLTAGNALFVQDFGRGIFFTQLGKWYPFLPASFINLDFAAQLTEKIIGISYSSFMSITEIINPILFLLLLFLLWRYIVSYQNRFEGFSPHFLFIKIGALIGITILVLLAYLTLTYKAIPWGYIRWTHAQHARYFAFIYVFIPLLLFACIHHYKVSVKKSFLRFFVYIALVALAVETLHGVYYNAKILVGHKDLAIIRNADDGYRNFQNIISGIKRQNPDRAVIVSSPDQYYLHAASQLGYKAIFDHQNLGQADLKVVSKSILLIPVHEQELIIMKDYLERKKPKLLSTISGTNFYTEEIDPQ